jgi:hypothetical protein
VITTSTLWLDISLGILAAGIVLGALLLLTWWDRRRQERAAAQLHVPQHRADDGTGGGNAPLAPSPVEVIRPAGYEQERTEEMPRVEAPVEHVEVTEDLGLDGYAAPEPSAELAEPTEAERRMADLHDEALWENEYRDSRRRHDKAVARFHTSATDHVIDEWLRGEERLPFLVEARCAASETAMEHTGEISAAALFGEKVGAR